MSTSYLNDFRDDIRDLLESIDYDFYEREEYEPDVVMKRRAQLQNGTIASFKDAYVSDSAAIPSTQFTPRAGYDNMQQDIFISTMYEYNLVQLKANQEALMAEIANVLNANTQLSGKADRLQIVSARKGYTANTVIDPAETVVGGLDIQIRIFYKTKKC